MPVVLADFVRCVPQPLTSVLVQVAPLLAAIRYAVEMASWRRSWHSGWLLVAVWWALCLTAETVLRYLLPLFVLALIFIMPYRGKTPILASEQSLHMVVSDLQTIYLLLPTLSLERYPSNWRTTLRVAAILYIPYLLITHYVPLRILLALAGTALLLTRAPFIHLVGLIIYRSAWCRFAIRHFGAFITGKSLPPVVYSPQPAATSPASVPQLRFIFTIYENQRWWMGLDWTAALLPNERPSWCSASPLQSPVSPPSAFELPSPSTVFLPDGKGNRVKRTAVWRWEEPEWKVVVRTDAGRINRVDRPVPDDTTDSGGGKFLKVAGKLGELSITNAPNSSEDIAFDGGPMESEEDATPTDPDGWVYGDNKWEALSGKGGIGKYTRQRQWTRVAVVYETTEVVEDGPSGALIMDPLPADTSSTPDQGSIAVETISKSREESPLKQRLRRALSISKDPNQS